jgi:CBS domain-containing protein
MVAPTTPAAECRQRMRECGVRRLPVVDGDALIGWVTDQRAFGPQPSDATAADLVEGAPLIAHPDDSLHDTLQRCVSAMQEAVLVLDRGRVVGILTEHDMVAHAILVLDPAATVQSVASTAVAAIEASMPATQALNDMRRSFLRHLIVTENGRLYGVLSMRDLLGQRAEGRTAREFVSGPVQWTTTWDTTLRDAGDTMVRHRVGCLPVLPRHAPDRVEGVICRSDLIRAVMRSGAVGGADLPADWSSA